MRTLQEKYNGINEGKFTKDQFLRDARMEQPSLVTQYNGYDDAVKILKNRGMIRETYSTEESFKDYSDDALADMIINSSRFEGNEESIARVKQELARRKKANLSEARLTNKSLTDYRYKPTNDMDKYPYEQILRGLRVELEGLNILRTPTPEEYKKALGKVLKNLEKDTIFYTNQVAGVSKKVDLHDKMVDVKKDNAVDKFNGLKKAQLKEAIKGVIKNILSENSDPDLYDQDEERDGRRFVYNDQGDFGLESEFGDSFDNLDPDFEGGIDEEVYEMYGSGKRIPDDTYIGDDTWYQDDEIDYDDENFSDPLIDGDEADDIPHPRGYEEASDEEDFDDLFEGNKSEKELRAEWEKYQATCHPEDKMSYMEWRSEQGLNESISLFDILDENYETDPYNLNDKTDYRKVGKEAFIKGKRRNENPYSIESPAGIDWDEGWDEAQSEESDAYKGY